MSDIGRKRVLDKRARHHRSQQRIRRRVSGTSERPRLAVFKSLKYIYAQVIDDRAGKTLAQANSREQPLRKGLNGSTGSKAAARRVGEEVAKRAKEQGVESVVLDRGGWIYHGKIKELAEGARAQGLKF